MAKKRGASPPKRKAKGARKGNGATRNKQSKKEVERILGDGRRPPRRFVPPRPKTPELPGLEGMASSKALNKVCSSLADIRHSKKDLVQQEAGLLDQALRVMRSEGRHLYRGHGIELVRKAGAEKVTARLTSETGTVEEESATDVAEGDAGITDGQTESAEEFDEAVL